MNDFTIVIFLVKFAIVVATLSFAIYRAGAFEPLVIARSGGCKMPRSFNHAPRRVHKSARAATTEYAPSQVIIDEATGNKWRLCAGVAVLNSQNQLLVGERIGKPNSWQCPQGGVDDAWTPSHTGVPREKETIVEAAAREMYEEIGLELGHHVMLDPIFPTPSFDATDNTGVRYSTAGTSNWLTRSGFAGQELHWAIFRCMDGRGDYDPCEMCDLSGKGDEKPEFTRVQWIDVDSAVQGIWEGKRAPYLALQAVLNEHAGKWEERVSTLDFSGKWSRDSKLSSNVVEGLMARGLAKEEATTEAENPYVQTWERDKDDSMSWHVTTYQDDGTSPRRKLEYKPGSWEEMYQGKSSLFGESDSAVALQRRTSYVGEVDADPIPIAQITITTGPKGIEESRRYRKGNHFYLRRTLWPSGAPNTPVISTEVFAR